MPSQKQDEHFGYLQQACAHLQRQEEELRQFLKLYYAQVGALFEQLTSLRLEAHGVEGKKAESVPLYTQHGLIRKRDEQKEIRQLYHRLVKRYHPDITQDDSNKQVLQWVNAAYAERNRWALMELEQGLCTGQGAANITDALKRVQLRLSNLQQSDAWQLKMRIEEDNTLLSRIITYVKQEIARLKAKLSAYAVPTATEGSMALATNA